VNKMFISRSVWMKPVDTLVEQPNLKFLAGPKVCYAVCLFLLISVT
jgi:hypothetical protein